MWATTTREEVFDDPEQAPHFHLDIQFLAHLARDGRGRVLARLDAAAWQ